MLYNVLYTAVFHLVRKKYGECKTKIICYLEAFWHISNYGGLFGCR